MVTIALLAAIAPMVTFARQREEVRKKTGWMYLYIQPVNYRSTLSNVLFTKVGHDIMTILAITRYTFESVTLNQSFRLSKNETLLNRFKCLT